jgi:misacylated tRNA(Ala) deacylase
MTEELFRQDAYLCHCDSVVTRVDEEGIHLDRTVFYPQGGGQPGDRGSLILPAGESVEIVDTHKGKAPGEIVHLPAAGARLPEPGTRVRAEIDWPRRHRHMRMHTCLHLLSVLVVAPVTGGSVAADKGRLDFDLPEPTISKQRLTEELKELIQENREVSAYWITDEELAAQPMLVKTMSVRPPTGTGRVRLVQIAGLDLQPCGGTHVAAIGEVGPVRVAKIEKKSRHNRRVTIVFDD